MRGKRSVLDWERFDEKARSQEPPYEAAALAQFAAESVAVVRMITTAVPNQKSLAELLTVALTWPYIEAALLKIAAAYSTAGIFSRQWYNRFRPLVAKTMNEQVAVRVLFRAQTPPAVMSAIQRRVTNLSGNVTDTTLQQIRDVVMQARTDGVGVSELATRIRSQVFSDTITRARAQTIARTETVGALNEGAMLRARQSGVFRAKRWLSQQDGRVRESHLAAEAEGWLPMDQPYSNGLQYPHEAGAPPEELINCRCTQSFSDLTAAEANRGST
jgi:hypothetical protein